MASTVRVARIPAGSIAPIVWGPLGFTPAYVIVRMALNVLESVEAAMPCVGVARAGEAGYTTAGQEPVADPTGGSDASLGILEGSAGPHVLDLGAPVFGAADVTITPILNTHVNDAILTGWISDGA